MDGIYITHCKLTMLKAALSDKSAGTSICMSASNVAIVPKGAESILTIKWVTDMYKCTHENTAPEFWEGRGGKGWELPLCHCPPLNEVLHSQIIPQSYILYIHTYVCMYTQEQTHTHVGT